MQPLEFAKLIDISDLTVQPDGVLVIWKWKWMIAHESDADDRDEESSPSYQEKTPPNEASDAEDDRHQPSTINHTTTFKVIGCTKEQVYQEILRIVRDSLDQGRNIPVSLVPEPRNPFNSNAIAFTCMVNGKWHRIGYVVNEILNEVHNALNGGEIVQVEFSWVKYISDWTRSGPGFFAGVSVTKRGYWSHSVTRAASTR